MDGIGGNGGGRLLAVALHVLAWHLTHDMGVSQPSPRGQSDFTEVSPSC